MQLIFLKYEEFKHSKSLSIQPVSYVDHLSRTSHIVKINYLNHKIWAMLLPKPQKLFLSAQYSASQLN